MFTIETTSADCEAFKGCRAFTLDDAKRQVRKVFPGASFDAEWQSPALWQGAYLPFFANRKELLANDAQNSRRLGVVIWHERRRPYRCARMKPTNAPAWTPTAVAAD